MPLLHAQRTWGPYGALYTADYKQLTSLRPDQRRFEAWAFGRSYTRVKRVRRLERVLFQPRDSQPGFLYTNCPALISPGATEDEVTVRVRGAGKRNLVFGRERPRFALRETATFKKKRMEAASSNCLNNRVPPNTWISFPRPRNARRVSLVKHLKRTNIQNGLMSVRTTITGVGTLYA